MTFANIPQGYGDLVLVVTGGVTSGDRNMLLSINGDITAGNYSSVQMSGSGSSADGSAFGTPFRLLNYWGFLNTTLNALYTINLIDYSVSDKHKTVLSRSNNAANGVAAVALRWANTAPITSLTVNPENATYAIGSTFSLYGVHA
jgi:hypothetical protein